MIVFEPPHSPSPGPPPVRRSTRGGEEEVGFQLWVITGPS